MTGTSSSSVDDYIAAQPEDVQRVLRRVRSAIRRALPGAEEGISYRIPCYKAGGRPVVYFAGWKAHYSIYPATGQLVTALGEELAPYRISKGTIRFPLDRPVPLRLIARIARLRAQHVAADRARSTRHSGRGTGSTTKSDR
jgi:uncharacterized protein YdhG (YjbR/CyaY superfamily)